MKKLMIAAFAIMAAVAANAAATNWSIAATKITTTDNNPTTFYTGSGNIVLYYSVSGANEWSALTDMRDAKTAAGSNPVTFHISSTTPGKITASENVFFSDSFTPGADYDFYFTITDGDKVFTSKTLTGKGAQADSKVGLDFGNQLTGGGTWAVPEPTSGLLLLLGMAGLALRRRRA